MVESVKFLGSKCSVIDLRIFACEMSRDTGWVWAEGEATHFEGIFGFTATYRDVGSLLSQFSRREGHDNLSVG